MQRIFLLVILLVTFQNSGKAQEEDKNFVFTPDLHFRTFWMNTNYTDQGFKEDYALGMSLNLGALLRYQQNWKFHIGYRTFANVASSEIWDRDPASNQPNRYETGLFDLLDTRDRFFGKLETFSLEYSTAKFGIKTGRMGINSDWINAQDGRLSPTAIEGIKGWFTPNPNWKVTLWGISRMSIRGSSEWFSTGKTIGIFPMGRTVSGQSADYFGSTSSSWISIVEVDRDLEQDASLHFSNTIAQNLFSTYWVSFEKNQKVKSGSVFYGLQAGIQHGLGNGGNENPDLQYKDPEDLNFALSTRLGWRSTKWTAHVNVSHVGGKGRWLSPREWGKDAWYTFIPRERNEGFESMNALVGYGEYRFSKAQISVYGHLGFHWLSDVNDAAANKYNFPSYRQLNLGIKYQPQKLKNLDIHLLLVNKQPLSSVILSSNQVYNKVEMFHFNGIINLKWN